MEINNIHKDAAWYSSYEDSDQGVALIECCRLKIKQLLDIVKIIKGEIELTENPQEYSAEAIIQSIKGIIENIPEVSYTKGYFKWVG